MKGEVFGKRELSPLVGLSKKGKTGGGGKGPGPGRNKSRR
jgi:small subunit ribosomal protein S3